MRIFVPVLVLAVLCGCGDKPATVEDLNTRDVTLPGGQVIHVETAMDTQTMMKGLMFRTSLAPDRGMLFVYKAPTTGASFWMYQTLIPLDIIWMDSSRRVVEMAENVPPCKTQASKCPSYGGHEPSQFVLEIAGGMAKKYGIKPGEYLNF
jgi:uncharacterized membrane protein (UPF0127 family)